MSNANETTPEPDAGWNPPTVAGSSGEAAPKLPTPDESAAFSGLVPKLAIVVAVIASAIAGALWWQYRAFYADLAATDDFLRDSRTSTKVLMEPRLFDILWHVRRRLGSEEPWRILSAYRSPETNAWLAGFTRGVATRSLHMRGQAVDVMLPGRTAAQIQAAARELGLGGVGYYPSSGFVHIDTGPVRYW